MGNNGNRVTTGWKTHLVKKNNVFLRLQKWHKAKGHICHYVINLTPDCHPSNSRNTGAESHKIISLPLHTPIVYQKDRQLNSRRTIINFIQALLADKNGNCKSLCLRGKVVQPSPRRKRKWFVLSVGLFIYQCKPAYEITDIFAVRSDLRATNQTAVQP